MTIKNDRWIKHMAEVHGMIEPFSPTQIRQNESGRIISYGTSSYGYDIRCADEFKIFTNINSTVIDPKNFDDKCFVDFKGPECIIPPNSFALARTVEYFRIPRNVLTVCLGKSTYARCFTGDTKVALADGTSPSFIELIERSNKGEKLFGYSVNDEQKIVISEFISPRKIGTEKVISVTLDDGSVIRATPDHKFITLDGVEVEAKDLKEGTSLMPLYRAVSNGYEAVVQPHEWKFELTHRLADEWNIRNNVYSPGENEHRHHQDNNRRNNCPSNITRVNATEHIRQHNRERMEDAEWVANFSRIQTEAYKRNSKDPAWLAARIEQCRKGGQTFWNLEDTHQSHIQRAKSLQEYWESQKGILRKEELRQMRRILNSDVNFLKELSERAKAMWLDEEFREMMSQQCGTINLRTEIDEAAVKDALEKSGSIRGAARLLDCDRTVFRRFKSIILNFKEKLIAKRITDKQFMNAMRLHGTAVKACEVLKISKSFAKRHFQHLISAFYGRPIANNHKVHSVVDHGETQDVYCLTAPEFGNFALEAGVFVNNCGIVVNVTPFEPEWEGYVTLEFSNTTPLPAKIYANEGCAQVLFFESDEACEVSYKDRGGKYQNQTGVVVPRM